MIINRLKRKRKKTILALCLFALSAFSGLALAQNYPSYRGYVNDFANIIDQQTERNISRYAGDLERKTTAQLAVVTVDSTQPQTIEQYAVRLFEKWGIGQKGKDNGVLLLVAVKDRNVRIETGYGLEGALPDAMCHEIVQSLILPEFRANRFSQGILSGATAIVSLTAKEYDVEVTGQEQQVAQRMRRQIHPLFRLFRFLLSLLFFLFIIGSRFGLLGWLFFGMLGRRSHWYGSSSGGFGGGLGGGGFGGFGGGLSGGGGSSGSW